MPIRPVQYYFGRLNILANYDDKRKFLLKALKTKKKLEHRNSNWGFFEIKELQSEFGDFIHGFLVKYRPDFSEEVANEETHNLQIQDIENFVIAKSRFFLHIESGLIAYHPSGNAIRPKIFKVRFTKLFEFALDDFFISTEIQSIEEEFKIFDAIKRFQKIRTVNIYLHPSNPTNRDRWKRTDDRLKELRVGSYQEKYDAEPVSGDLDIREDEEIASKIVMADDGYGIAEVSGILDNEEKKISTGDNPTSTQAPNDEESAENVLEALANKIRELFGRFKK